MNWDEGACVAMLVSGDLGCSELKYNNSITSLLDDLLQVESKIARGMDLALLAAESVLAVL